MAFCDHCQGQRFDRAQVLRMLRASRRQFRRATRNESVDEALAEIIRKVASLDIVHFEVEDESEPTDWVH
ncbi:MAG TPA: hypothetical protein VFA59_06575 [Vicinamibacterales bacterium]|nr:hypothetical protein [Vicinamibacterales bacterium]